MKVCIASVFSLHKGSVGSQTHAKWLMQYCKERGIPCVYVSPHTYAKSLVYPVFAIRYLIKRWSPLLDTMWFREWHYYFLKKALAGVFRQRIDVIDAQGISSALAALTLRTKAPYKYQVVLTVHMTLPSEAEEEVFAGKIKRGGRYYKKLRMREKFVFLNADKIIFSSAYIKGALEREYPELKNRNTELIYYGIGNGAKSQGSEPATSKEGEALKLINIGTLGLRKNQRFLLRVMRGLVAEHSRIELHLVGAGEGRASLEKLACGLGIKDHVKFRGHMPCAQQCLKDSYLYLHSSLAESAPLAIIEAMSFGVPTIALAAGGIREIIRHGYNGFIVEGESVESFSRHAKELILDKEKYKQMSARCIEIFRQNFDYRLMGKNVIEFYKKAP